MSCRKVNRPDCGRGRVEDPFLLKKAKATREANQAQIANLEWRTLLGFDVNTLGECINIGFGQSVWFPALFFAVSSDWLIGCRQTFGKDGGKVL